MKNNITDNNIEPTTILEEVGRDLTEKLDIQCEFYESLEDLSDPRDLDKTKKNLIIFDDLLLEKQNTCEKYYIRDRHSNVDSFYLAQNYFRLLRRTIRENCYLICLFQQDLNNANRIYNDHVNANMRHEEFRELYKKAWSQPHIFVTIDLTSDKLYGKYRIDFDIFYIMYYLINGLWSSTTDNKKYKAKGFFSNNS